MRSFRTLPCKVCGNLSLRMAEIPCQQEKSDPARKPMAHFYLCHVCGDNYLAVKHYNSDTSCDVTYRHFLDRVPRLLRVAHFKIDEATGEQELASWGYFIDCRPVGEEEWHHRLERMRQALTRGCQAENYGPVAPRRRCKSR